jgi:hypothetical protein
VAQELTDGPREGLDPDEVRDTLTLVGGRQVRTGVDVLDMDDRPTDEALPLDLGAGGSVDWAFSVPKAWAGPATAQAAVRRTGKITLAGAVDVDLLARRLRPWMELASPKGTAVRFWLGVFDVTLPPADDDGTVVRRELDLADKSHAWSARTLADPLTVAPGTNLVQWVKDDLASRFGEQRFAFVPSDHTAQQPYTFDTGTTVGDVYAALMDAAAYDLTVDEQGRPEARPLSQITGASPGFTYGPGLMPITVPGKVEALLPSMPNRVRFAARQGPSLAEEGNGIVTVTNQSTGPASVDKRGGHVVEQVVTVDAETQDALAEYAAAQAQVIFAGGGLSFTGKVGLNPSLGDRDVLEVIRPRLGLSGRWSVTAWSLPLGRMNSQDQATMSVTCQQQVAVS